MCLYTAPIWSCGHSSLDDSTFYTSWPDPSTCGLHSPALTAETALQAASFRSTLIPLPVSATVATSPTAAAAATVATALLTTQEPALRRAQHPGRLDLSNLDKENNGETEEDGDKEGMARGVRALEGRIPKPPGTWSSECRKTMDLVVALEPVGTIECTACFAGVVMVGDEGGEESGIVDGMVLSPESGGVEELGSPQNIVGCNRGMGEMGLGGGQQVQGEGDGYGTLGTEDWNMNAAMDDLGELDFQLDYLSEAYTNHGNELGNVFLDGDLNDDDLDLLRFLRDDSMDMSIDENAGYDSNPTGSAYRSRRQTRQNSISIDNSQPEKSSRHRKPRPSARLPSPVLHGPNIPDRSRKDNLYLPEVVHSIRGTTAMTAHHRRNEPPVPPNPDNLPPSSTDIAAENINAFIAAHASGTVLILRDPITGRPLNPPSPPAVPAVFDTRLRPRSTTITSSSPSSTKPSPFPPGSRGFCSPPLRRVFGKFHHSQHEFSLYTHTLHAPIFSAWRQSRAYALYLQSSKRKHLLGDVDPLQQFMDLRKEEGLEENVEIMFDDVGSVFLFCRTCAMAFKYPFTKKWVTTYRGHENTQMHVRIRREMESGLRGRGIEQYML